MPTFDNFLELNPTTLKSAKTLWSFGSSECSRVKAEETRTKMTETVKYGAPTLSFLAE